MSRLIIFDYSNLLFRGLYALPNLTHGKFGTSGLYGFLLQLTKHISEFGPTHILICGDSSPYKRAEVYPEYKQRRDRERSEEDKQRITDAFTLTKEFLDLIQIPIWRVKGLEADDLIAIACKQLHKKFDAIRIVSNDDDLFQLLEYENVQLRRHNKLTMTKKVFKKQFPEVDPKDWHRVTAITGGHNGLPGLKGYGFKRALAAIRDPEVFKELYKKHGEEIDLYSSLTKLPYPLDKELTSVVKVPILSKGVYHERKVMTFLASYGVNLTESIRAGLEFICSTGKISKVVLK